MTRSGAWSDQFPFRIRWKHSVYTILFSVCFQWKKLFLAEGICFVYATFWSRTLLTHWSPAIKLQQHKVYVALWQEFAYIRLVMQNVCGPNLLLSLFTLLEIQLIEYKLENELVTFVDYIINNFTLSWRQVISTALLCTHLWCLSISGLKFMSSNIQLSH